MKKGTHVITQEGFWKGWKDSMSRHKFIHNWRHMTYWHLFSPNELRIQIVSCSDSHCRWGLLPPKEHLATSTDSFDCHDYSRSLTSSWERPGILPKSYHALDSASHSPPNPQQTKRGWVQSDSSRENWFRGKWPTLLKTRERNESFYKAWHRNTVTGTLWVRTF